MYGLVVLFLDILIEDSALLTLRKLNLLGFFFFSWTEHLATSCERTNRRIDTKHLRVRVQQMVARGKTIRAEPS